MEHPIASPRTYWLTYIALLVLLGLTIVAALVDLGPFNVVVSLVIASMKAALVILFFMHVRFSRKLTRLFAVGGFFWLLILFGLLFADYVSRVTVLGL